MLSVDTPAPEHIAVICAVVCFSVDDEVELLKLSDPGYEPAPLVAGPSLNPGFVPVVGVEPGKVIEVGLIFDAGAHVTLNVIGVVEGAASEVQLLPELLYEAVAVPLAAFTVPPPPTLHFFSEALTEMLSVFAVPPVIRGGLNEIVPVTLAQVSVPG
jgi:hypothetical protein